MTTTSSPKAGWILFAVSILGIMIQIDFTAVNVALIAIGHTLKANLSTVQWALSAYILAWGALVLPAGRLADLFGKRRTFLAGTILFMAGSALTGLATQSWFLILGRIVQGMGGALFLPGIYTLVFTAFADNNRGFALGVLTSAISIGLAIGPTFGGVVVHLLNWRWIFFLNLPLGFPVIGIILWAVQREPWRLSGEAMDYLGGMLIAIALTMLMIALNQANAWGIASTRFILAMTGALALLTVFILYERRQAYPLVQLKIFSNPIFLGSSLTYIAMGFTFATVLIVGGLYLQNALDYSAFNTGFIFLIMTIMFAWLSIYGGKLVDRMDARIPIISGGVTTAAALVIFILCTQHSPLWMPMLALALFGAGGGLSFPALNAIMMKSVPQNLLSTASSAFAMFGCIGNTLGLILSSTVIITFGQRSLHSLLKTQTTVFSPKQITILNNVIGSTHYSTDQLSVFPTDSFPHLLNLLRTAFIHGMNISMWIGLAFTVAGIVISTVMITPISPTNK